MQGAGGAGGLLAMTDDSTGLSCYYAHDGNGNVVALVNATDGTAAARYEYGPFAEPIRMTGPMALANPMRFSGQFADDVLRTLKYLHREYVPSTGRWLSRDPIDQKGGINLYSFVLNDPIDAFDLIGEKPFWCGPLEKKIRSYLSTPEELRAWDQFVNGSGDIKLSVSEMDSIVNSSARYTTVLDAWMADCTKPWAAWTDRVATIADTLGSPWAYAIGQLSITLKSSCHCGCLSFQTTIKDHYDFDIQGIPYLFGRPGSAEFAVWMVRIAQGCALCGWKEFDHIGWTGGSIGNCPTQGPLRKAL